MFKKIFAAFLCALMICGAFAGCGADEQKQDAPVPAEPKPFDSTDALAFYIKDGELTVADMISGEKKQLTTHLNASSRYGTEAHLTISDDASRAFFYDRPEEGAEHALCYCDMTVDGQPQKIAEAVHFYLISRDGNTVYYKTAEPKTFCRDMISGTTGEISYEEFKDVAVSIYDDGRYDYDGTIDYMPENEADKRFVVDGIPLDEKPDYNVGVYEYRDRLLYFTGTHNWLDKQPDDIPFEMKLYIKGQQAPVVVKSTLDLWRFYVAFAADGGVLYLEKYNEETKTGDLMCYRDGQHVKIDTDVSTPADFTATESIITRTMTTAQTNMEKASP